ncbi:MAG: hypothetical protein ACMVY4_14800 [Minwuia sp.]|uniref:hypothetical protein n=1 Tax=Minwuia sp. TaxID=2493630 RepID=UPI003A887FD9
MFFSRKRQQTTLEPGTRHVRQIGGRAVEEAEVVDVSVDGMGIPHVSYRVRHLQSGRNAAGGLRILALSCFLEQFRQLDRAA